MYTCMCAYVSVYEYARAGVPPRHRPMRVHIYANLYIYIFYLLRFASFAHRAKRAAPPYALAVRQKKKYPRTGHIFGKI